MIALPSLHAMMNHITVRTPPTEMRGQVDPKTGQPPVIKRPCRSGQVLVIPHGEVVGPVEARLLREDRQAIGS